MRVCLSTQLLDGTLVEEDLRVCILLIHRSKLWWPCNNELLLLLLVFSLGGNDTCNLLVFFLVLHIRVPVFVHALRDCRVATFVVVLKQCLDSLSVWSTLLCSQGL